MIYVFLADGFEEIEAIAPIDILRRANHAVKTVGIAGMQVSGTHGIAMQADMTIDELEDGSETEMLVLPGGQPGVDALCASERLKELLRSADQRRIPIGAICAAPSILGRIGLLDGVRATCYPGFEQYLTGAVLSQEGVVSDGRYVTAWGAGVSVEFGLALVALLDSPEEARKLGERMQCPKEKQ